MVPYTLQTDAWWLDSPANTPRRPAIKPVSLDKTAPSCDTKPMTYRVLIVDDDPHIRDVIRMALEGAGMRTAEAANGQLALMVLARDPFDLVVLDIGMPQMDGFETCKAIRATSAVPVLFLTARDDEIDRVLGFQLGADDFVPKPFSPRELVLRIKAILSRGKAQKPQALGHGALKMTPGAHGCSLNGQDLGLTGTEFGLLKCLLQRPDQVFSRNQLIDALYGANSYMSGRTLDSHIRNIRAKAAQAGCDDVVATVHGVGFKLGACN